MEKQYRLPKAFAEKWLVALRSGNYKQTDSCLYVPSKDAYCCLGVAGNLCGIPNKSMEYNSYFQGSDFSKSSIYKYRKMGYPKELSTIESYIENHTTDLAEQLAIMNDAGKTFLEIADWIEKNVEFYE